MHAHIKGAVGLAGIALVLAACAAPPLEPLALTPAGPVSIEVGQGIDFTASPIPNGVDWSVDGVDGGSAAVGTISAAGSYTAPARVPSPAVVDVRATDAIDASRSAAAAVTITAPGTMYVLDDDIVYVYGDVDTVDGDVAPDRTFTLDGLDALDDFSDLLVVPSLDLAFVTASPAVVSAPTIARVPNISSASGVLTAFTPFDIDGYGLASGVAYDETRDVLYVAVRGALLAYADASTAAAGSTPDRVVTGANYTAVLPSSDVRIRLDAAADRLFVSSPAGDIGVFDQASTLDGNVGPTRTISIDQANVSYVWGLAYDAGRDELYVGDQRVGTAIYVIEDASTASGSVAPTRTLGGPTNPLASPSQISYDALNDRLAVVLTVVGFAIFDDVSTLDGDVAPDRVVTGPSLPLISGSWGGFLDPTQ